jgi:hypothetical protein
VHLVADRHLPLLLLELLVPQALLVAPRHLPDRQVLLVRL